MTLTHDLRGVHRGTTTQRDNHVWFEGVCQFCTFTNDAQGRVRFYFEEDFSFNACCFQYGSDLISITIVDLEDMKTGFNILREIMVEGYRPSIARLYDAEDGTQHFTHFADGKCVLIFMAEGNPRKLKVARK